MDTLISRAAGGGTAQPAEEVKLEVRWIDPPQDQHTQGESGGKPDAFEGDTLRAVVQISNGTGEPLRDVRLGYWFEEPFLRATRYAVETDHPSRDRTTWTTSDTSPENPAGGEEMGASGELVVDALGAGESKRVVVDLAVGPPSIGQARHPDVRFWLRHVEDAYNQPSFGVEADPNAFGKKLEGFTEVDILSQDRWFFAADDEAQLEGWTACHDGHHGALKLNTDPGDSGLLTVHVTGRDACLASPPWTRIDADAHNQLVLQVRSHDGPHRMALLFRREGDAGFDESRAVRFGAAGSGQTETLVLPMSGHPDWVGAVIGLQIHPLEGAAPAEGARGWYGIDAVFLQSSKDKLTNAPGIPYVESQPVIFLEGADPIHLPRPELDGQADRDVRVETGSCAAASRGPGPAPSAVFALLALLGLGARRQRKNLNG